MMHLRPGWMLGTAVAARQSASGAPVAALSLDLTTALDPLITFSRASLATMYDSTGKLTYAPNNLALQSQTLDSGTWAVTAVSVTADSTTAPDATTTADTIVEDTSSNAHRISQNFTIESGGAFLVSCYMKANTRSWGYLVFSDNSAHTAGQWFDLTNGVIGTGNVFVGSATVANATMTSVGNGWYRCSARFGLPAGAATTGVMRIGTSNADNTQTYVGASLSIFAWGAQCERITYQTAPASYMPTVASTFHGPRFDYDPVALTPRGLLIEEARTNLALRSEDFTTGWGAGGTNLTFTANSTTSPGGNTTADTLNESASSQTQRGATSVTLVAGGGYTVSCYLKAGTQSWAYLGLTDVTANTGFQWFNLGGVALGSTATVGSATVSGATITSVGNGWLRCTCFVQMPGGSATAGRMYVGIASGNSVQSYLGANLTIFAWGAQTELGAVATSYIPTVAATVTRAVDIATMTSTNFSSWFNQSEGTFVYVGDWIANASTIALAVEKVSDAGSGADTHWLYAYANKIQVRVSSADTGTIDLADTISGKRAYAYKVNDFAYCSDGGTVGTDTSGAVPASQDRLSIGGYGGTSLFNINGHMKSLTYYNTRLPDATLQTLTT